MHTTYNYPFCASLSLPFPISLVMVVIVLKCSGEEKKEKMLVVFFFVFVFSISVHKLIVGSWHWLKESLCAIVIIINVLELINLQSKSILVFNLILSSDRKYEPIWVVGNSTRVVSGNHILPVKVIREQSFLNI